MLEVPERGARHGAATSGRAASCGNDTAQEKNQGGAISGQSGDTWAWGFMVPGPHSTRSDR